MVINENDLPPFVTISKTNFTEAQKSIFDQYYNSGVSSINENDYLEALDYLNKSLEIDSGAAKVHYQLGICYENLGDYKKAKKEFLIAKDFDGLRFRAPSEFNKIILNLSAKNKIPLADVNKNFEDNSPSGILGSSLLIDHVHPNIKGYFLLAKTWYQTIINNNLLGLSKNSIENDSLIWNKISVTEVDSLIGELKIIKLKSKPPFSARETEFSFYPSNTFEKIAYEYVKENKISWGEAHILAADEYLKKDDFKNALMEYKAILVTDENNPNLLSVIGDLYYNMKEYSKAERSYIKSYYIKKVPYLKYSLGLTSLKLGKTETAIKLLQNCLKENETNPGYFTEREIADIKFNLSLASNISEKED